MRQCFRFIAILLLIKGSLESLLSDSVFGGTDSKNFQKLLSDQFQMLDINHDGYIELSELEDRVRHIQETALGSDKYLYKISNETISLQFKLMDLNHDSKISFTEFKKVMTNNVLNKKVLVVPDYCVDSLEKIQSFCSPSKSREELGEMKNAIRLNCYSGVSALFSYASEICIIESSNCNQTLSCFDNTFSAENVKDLSSLVHIPGPLRPKLPGKFQNTLNAIEYSMFYIIYLSCVVMGYFIPAPFNLITSVITTSFSGLALLLLVRAQTSHMIFKNMGLTKLIPDSNAILSPVPRCDVVVYWSRVCATLGSKDTKVCSDGGSVVSKYSCNTHFSKASHPCGVQGLGCQPACYNANLSCDDPGVIYKSVECEHLNLNYAGNTVSMPVRSFGECRSKFLNGSNFLSFVFAAANWGEPLSHCYLYSNEVKMDYIEALDSSKCVYGSR